MLEEVIASGIKASTPVDTVTRILTNDQALEAATPPTDIIHIDTTHIVRNDTPPTANATPVEQKPPESTKMKGLKTAILQKPAQKTNITGQRMASFSSRKQK